MGSLVLTASLTALALLILMWKVNIYRFLGYHIQTDIASTGVVTLLFGMSGTYSGMTVAILTGLMISLILIVLRWAMGYEKYESGEWVYHHNNPDYKEGVL